MSQKTYRQQLIEKYGTCALGAFTTNEEKVKLYQEESPEFYRLECRRNEIRQELQNIDTDTNEAVNLLGELEKVEIEINLLSDAQLAEFFAK